MEYKFLLYSSAVDGGTSDKFPKILTQHFVSYYLASITEMLYTGSKREHTKI